MASSRLSITKIITETKSQYQTTVEMGATSYMAARSASPSSACIALLTALPEEDQASSSSPKMRKAVKAKLRKSTRKTTTKCSMSSTACLRALASCASLGWPRSNLNIWKVITIVYQKSARRYVSDQATRFSTLSRTSPQAARRARTSSSAAPWPGAAGRPAILSETPEASCAMSTRLPKRRKLTRSVTTSRITQKSQKDCSSADRRPQTARMNARMTSWRSRQKTRVTQMTSRTTYRAVGYSSAATVWTWTPRLMPPLRSKSKRTSSRPRSGGRASALSSAACRCSDVVATSSQPCAFSMCSTVSRTECTGLPVSRYASKAPRRVGCGMKPSA
mmetsp:Transcript_7121/g.20987  ORF Transcript_7121/g.20987 Transcript_7121/m.20987 type:complete len:334 (+) Transcript_7121:860-1861(+)